MMADGDDDRRINVSSYLIHITNVCGEDLGELCVRCAIIAIRFVDDLVRFC